MNKPKEACVLWCTKVNDPVFDSAGVAPLSGALVGFRLEHSLRLSGLCTGSYQSPICLSRRHCCNCACRKLCAPRGYIYATLLKML